MKVIRMFLMLLAIIGGMAVSCGLLGLVVSPVMSAIFTPDTLKSVFGQDMSWWLATKLAFLWHLFSWVSKSTVVYVKVR